MEEKKIMPLLDRILVTEKTQTPDNGIYLPTTPTQRSFLLQCIASGPDVKEIKVGQTVLIAKYAGVEVPTTSDQKQYIIRECDVLGVMA